MRPTENLRGSEDTAESAQGAEVSEKTDEADTRSLERIQSLMGEILRKSSNRDGDCLYRGDTRSADLLGSVSFCRPGSIENAGTARTRRSRYGAWSRRSSRAHAQYTILADDDEILAEIQHFGGTTNLVDVTDDYLIALLFASAGSERPGIRQGGVALARAGQQWKGRSRRTTGSSSRKACLRSARKGFHRARRP